jgi:hypothetical protein
VAVLGRAFSVDCCVRAACLCSVKHAAEKLNSEIMSQLLLFWHFKFIAFKKHKLNSDLDLNLRSSSTDQD